MQWTGALNYLASSFPVPTLTTGQRSLLPLVTSRVLDLVIGNSAPQLSRGPDHHHEAGCGTAWHHGDVGIAVQLGSCFCQNRALAVFAQCLSSLSPVNSATVGAGVALAILICAAFLIF